ncbi:MAG: TonB-dependent receptor [Saprospiraceae bacterium]|nr:TonB-dependent receptor [Saprospiraceae bacterium]
MRIVFLILFLLFVLTDFVTSQSRPDQKKITYKAYHQPLKSVLKDLANMASISIVYSESRLPADKPVSVSAEELEVGEVLRIILSNFDFTYQLVGEQIVLHSIFSQYSQKNARIYGYLRDKSSGETLIGANIFLADKSIGTASNEYGFYSLQLPAKSHRVYFSYLGYKTEIIEFSILKDTLINIYLTPDGQLNEIVILDNILEEEMAATYQGQKLHIDKISAGNHLAGEADVIRYVGQLPGVNTGSDGIGGLNVRGGSADQNLILLDGVPLYNTGHALGMFSVFNSDIVKDATFIKGSIPARYGGRLSSILDVHTKDGNFNNFSGEVSLSTIALKASVEGPIAKGNSSFLLSYRRTYLDVWIKELTKYINNDNNQTGFSNYFFQDFNAKLNLKLNRKNRLFVNFYSGNDNFENNTAYDFQNVKDKEIHTLDWGNRMLSLKLSSELGSNIFSKFTLYYSGFQFENYNHNQFLRLESLDTTAYFKTTLFDSGIKEYGAFYEIDWMPHKKHYLKVGTWFQNRQFSPRVVGLSGQNQMQGSQIDPESLKRDSPSEDIISNELTAYIEDEWQISKRSKLNIGLHYSGIGSKSNVLYHSLQPRISFLTTSENIVLKTGVSRLQQFLHLLTNNGLGLPTDIWLPSDENLPPARSWVFDAGIGYRDNNGYKTGIDIYFKTFDDISSFREGGNIDIHQNVNWKGNIPTGKGQAYGVETYFEKVTGNTLFALNYTYSVSNRTFSDLNNGNPFPFNFNRLHSFKSSFTYRFSPFTELVLNWNVSSGNHFTSPSNTSLLLDSQVVVLYLEKNNARFPVFHRLDVGVSFYNSYKWGRTKLFLGVYNAYNRRNPFYTDLVRDRENPDRFIFRQYSLLPLLPTISYNISF